MALPVRAVRHQLSVVQAGEAAAWYKLQRAPGLPILVTGVHARGGGGGISGHDHQRGGLASSFTSPVGAPLSAAGGIFPQSLACSAPCTGHSMGGSTAALVALLLRNDTRLILV